MPEIFFFTKRHRRKSIFLFIQYFTFRVYSTSDCTLSVSLSPHAHAGTHGRTHARTPSLYLFDQNPKTYSSEQVIIETGLEIMNQSFED